MFIRPKNPRLFEQTLPVMLRLEDLRELHRLSKSTGKSIRRIVTDAVKNALEDAKEPYAF